MNTTTYIRRWLIKERVHRALMLVLSFTLLVVTCPVKKWLYADNPASVPAAARTHETGIRSGAYSTLASLTCVSVEKADFPSASVAAAPLKKPVPFLHYDIYAANGSALSYFLSSLPRTYSRSLNTAIPSLPLYLQFRSLLI